MASAVSDRVRREEEAEVSQFHTLMDDRVAAALTSKKEEILDVQVLRSLDRTLAMIPGYRQAPMEAPLIEGLKPHAKLVDEITASPAATKRFMDRLGYPKLKKPPKGDQVSAV